MDTSYIDNLNCMIDLHLHLDGAISLENAKALASLQNIELPSDEEVLEMLQVKPDCKDLEEFLEKFAFPNTLLQTKAALTLATKNLLEELNKVGVMYCEIRFAPQKSCDQGLTQKEAVEAVLGGIAEGPIDAGLILCAMRDDQAHMLNMETLRLAKVFQNKGVVALDLAGFEPLYNDEHFTELFSIANQMCLNTTIHSGEACGPEKVRQSLDMHASRIGHGVRSIEDESVFDLVKDTSTPLELCPSSNMCTQIFESMSEYPIRQFLDAGIVATINTDNPAIIGVSIKDEFKRIVSACSLSKEDVKQLLLNAAKASFVDDDTYLSLVEKIEQAL